MGVLVLTVIGDDRPGLVHALADVITRNGGNWEDSRLARLAGKFAGVVQVTFPGTDGGAIVAALGDLEGILEVTAHRASLDAPTEPTIPLRLDLVGADRPGILAELTRVLSDAGVNVGNLETESRDAPHAGERIFVVDAHLQAPADIRLEDVRASIEELGKDLMVDVTLDTAAEG